MLDLGVLRGGGWDGGVGSGEWTVRKGKEF